MSVQLGLAPNGDQHHQNNQSIELNDKKFQSVDGSKGKSQTHVGVKSTLKQGGKHNQNNPYVSNQAINSAAHEFNTNAKEAVRKTLYEIEDNFKLLKHLPNQRLHPFDLNSEEISEIKQYFPEFFPKNLAAKRQVQAKGIEVTALKALLEQKIRISSDKMAQIIAKLDHKSHTRITWTEFLLFLQNEGFRREAVNDAQLYGFGVKRLVEKARYKLLRTNEQYENAKVTEYYIEQLVYIKLEKIALVLAVFENNQARVFDATRDFKGVQDLEFPFQIMTSKQQAGRKSARPYSSIVPKSNHQPGTNIAARVQSAHRGGRIDNLVDFTADHTLEAIAENPSRGKSHTGTNKRALQSANQVRCKSSLSKYPMSSKKTKMVYSTTRASVQAVPELLRKDSSELLVQKYQGDPSIIAWKNERKTHRTVKDPDHIQFQKMKKYVLGIADMSSFYPQQDDIGIAREKVADQDDSYNDQIRLNDFYPGFKQQKQQLEHEFHKRIEETERQINDTSAVQKTKFDRFLKKEKERGVPEAEAIKRVCEKMGFISEQVGVLENEKQLRQYNDSKKEQNRCEIRIAGLKKTFTDQKKKLQELSDTNKPRQKQDNQPSSVSTQDNTFNSLQGGLQNEEHNDVYKSLNLHQDESRKVNLLKEQQTNAKKMPVKTTKAVHVTACDFNESIGLLALALIDKEVKIYHVKQSGAKVSLVESFSFMVHFSSGAAASCLQIERFVTNGRPIVCIGSSLGDVGIYYLDDEKSKREAKGGPTLLSKFSFKDRGMKVDLDEINEKSDEEVAPSIRISFKQDRSFSQIDQQELQGEKKNKNKQINQPVKSLESIQLVTDEYWDTVMMNTRERKQGPDGISLFNIVYPIVKDYDQSTFLVKELFEIKVSDEKKIKKIIESWISNVRITGGDIQDAVKNFRLQVQRLLNDWQTQERIQKQEINNDYSQAFTRKDSSFNNGNRKMSLLTTQNSGAFAMQKTNRSGPQSTTGAPQSTTGNLTNTEHADQDQTNKSVIQSDGKMAYATTAIRYIKDIGLIVSTFDGHIKIFDAFTFYLVWRNSNKQRTALQHTTISSFDISPSLGLMATAGVEGRIVLIDPYALGIINQTDAHPGVEIIKVFIYTSQQQIITVAQDRSIQIFDAFRLEKIQTIKDVGTTHAIKFTAVAFDEKTGHLFVGCQQINIWKAQVDCKTEIQALQVQTLSKAMMQERNMTELSKLGGSRGQSLTTTTDVKTGKVTVSAQSQLVSLIINKKDSSNLVITVDSDNLLRGWSMRDCSTTFSYKIPFKSRVTAAATDNECLHVAVGTCIGEIAVLNFSSGGVLYNLPHQDKEITCLKFLTGLGEFWLVAGTWGGKLVLYTEPNEDNNYQITAKCRIGHRGDVLVVDSAFNQIISGGVDGLLTVWNQFSGVMKFAIELPDPINETDPHIKISAVQNQIRKKISDVLFHPYYSNLVCVLQDSGNVHLVDISNRTIVADFVAFMKINSSWACCIKKQKVFVVGDMGRASIFDVRISKSRSMMEAMQQHVIRMAKGQLVYTGGHLKDHKWKMLTPWFKAHDIGKMDSCYVSSVHYAESINVFLSATSHGEVKLWQNGVDQVLPLGTLNSKDWSSETILAYIQSEERNQMAKNKKNKQSLDVNTVSVQSLESNQQPEE